MNRKRKTYPCTRKRKFKSRGQAMKNNRLTTSPPSVTSAPNSPNFEDIVKQENDSDEDDKMPLKLLIECGPTTITATGPAQLPRTFLSAPDSLKPKGSSEASKIFPVIDPTTIKTLAPVSEVNQRSDDRSQMINYGSENDSDDDDGDSLVFPNLDSDFEDDFPSPVHTSCISLSTSPLNARSHSSLAQPFPNPETLASKNLNEFMWQNLPSPPIPPKERREPFTANKCGPTASFHTPYEAFVAIWDRPIMEQIANQTNKYAEQWQSLQVDDPLEETIKPVDWTDTNADELYIFFAIILTTGVCIKTEMCEYWQRSRTIDQTPNFIKFMSFTRFRYLCRCLHFIDNDAELNTKTPTEAKLCKVAPIVKHLNEKFQSLYILSRDIFVDGILTQWKASLVYNQYIDSKVASARIKTYELYESKTGFLWKFDVYDSKKMEDSSLKSTSILGVNSALVIKLLSDLEHRGYTVWLDDRYQNPTLARFLKTLGFDCVGTVGFIPTELKNLKEKESNVGQLFGCTSGDVDLLVWTHEKPIALLSTYHGNIVRRKDGETKPAALVDYVTKMCGRKIYRMLEMYPIEMDKTKVWYKMLFKRLLNVTVVNSYILHKHTHSDNQFKRITNQREFRKVLVEQLLTHHAHKAKRPLLDVSSVTVKSHVFPEEVLDHFPVPLGTVMNMRPHVNCVLCRCRVATHCPGCEVPLCPFTCHKEWHSGSNTDFRSNTVLKRLKLMRLDLLSNET